MGYQQRPRASKPRGFERPRKVRSKTKSKKTRRMETHSGERNVPSPNEVVNRTLNSLHKLGNQVFALAPFYEHFDRWLMNLQTVLNDLETSQAVTIDDQFREERSQILSEIQSALKDNRFKEASPAEALRTLQNSKNTLSQTEQEHDTNLKEITHTKEQTIKPLMDKIEAAQGDLDRIQQIRAGFFRSVSKRTKAQKVEEAKQRLNSAKKELEEAEKSFATETANLQEEYERRKSEILEQIARNQREIERIETATQTDNSAETRRIACEKLADAVNALLKRTEHVQDKAESQP